MLSVNGCYQINTALKLYFIRNYNKNDIEAFLKMLGSFHVKTPALHFNFETCRAQFIQARIILLENLFVALSFNIVTDAINNSMNGKHWTLL